MDQNAYDLLFRSIVQQSNDLVTVCDELGRWKCRPALRPMECVACLTITARPSETRDGLERAMLQLVDGSTISVIMVTTCDTVSWRQLKSRVGIVWSSQDGRQEWVTQAVHFPQSCAAEILASRIRAAMGPPFSVDGKAVRIGISIGVSHTAHRLDEASVAEAEADRMLREARALRQATR